MFLLFQLIGSVSFAYGDGAGITLRTEIEDLQEIKSRLLVDFPASPYAPCRLMYVENRRSSDPVLQPERWSCGIVSPLVIGGPVSLHGILAQLYNPLAHGPGSAVFSDPPVLALDIDMDLTSRRGVQLAVIPGCWNLFGVYKKQIGVQLGSAVTVPVGPRLAGVLAGLISDAPDRLHAEKGWYADEPAFPGGLTSHLAGSLIWDLVPLRLYLVAAASGGRRIGPGALGTLHLSWTASHGELDLLLGYCSTGYYTPEGDSGDPEWMAAARIKRDFGPAHLSAGCSKEIFHLSPFAEAFRESRDDFSAGIEIIRRTVSGCAWSIAADAALQREWSPVGELRKLYALKAGTTLDWRDWRVAAGMNEGWGSDSERVRDTSLLISHDPPWGKAELEAGYRLSPPSGLRLSAAIEATGQDKRIYARLATKDVLSPVDFLQLFIFSVGWEAKSSRSRRPALRRSGHQPH